MSARKEVLPYTYSASSLNWTTACNGSTGKVRRTVILLFSRTKNVLIYGQGTDHGIKFIWKVNSILTSLCTIEISIKIFIGAGIAEFEIVLVVGRSWLEVYSTENIIEICTRWEWVYISRICSAQGITAIFDKQIFIHKIITLDNKVTIGNLWSVILRWLTAF